MKAELFFCERWGGNYKSPVTPMPRKKAEKLHAAGKPYCVLVGSETHPRATVHMTQTVAIVSFMNNNINPYVVYIFVRNDKKIHLNVYFYPKQKSGITTTKTKL